MLGNFYLRYFSGLEYEVKITSVNITLKDEVDEEVEKYKPSVIINTAAKTNLEWCVNNKLEAFSVNVLGTDNIAQICDKNDIYFIHLSSGCILESKDENDIKSETAIPKPESYYSLTKAWAENIIIFKRSNKFKYLILRPRQPISSEISTKNMLVKMLTFTKFIDVPNNGTIIEDLMNWTEKLIQKRVTGILHVVNTGWTTPYRMGVMLKKYVLPNLPVNKITKEELNTMNPEKRADAILDNSKLISIIGEVGTYESRMKEIIMKLAENFKTGDKNYIREQMEKTVASSKTRTVANDCWKDLLKPSNL